MHIITVSPISDKIPPQFDRVSFYWRDYLERGCIIPITFSNRTMYGIVVSSVHVREMKHLIKTSHFTMKKLDLQTDDIITPSGLTNFIFSIADITLQSPGKLWVHFFGEFPLSELVVAPLPEGGSAIAVGGGSNTSQVPTLGPLVLQEREIATHAYEYNNEKTIADLQNNPPDIVIVPTLTFCQILQQQLPQETIIITPVQLPDLLIKNNKNHTKLSIAVIHVSDTRYLHHEKNPYIDYREIIVPALKNLFSGSVILSLYDAYISLHVKNIFTLTHSHISTVQTPAHFYISQYDKDHKYGDTMFSRDTFTKILTTLEQDKAVQIITSRKGVSGSVSCSNCAFIARCSECSHIQSIIKNNKTGTRNLYCHQCRTKSPVYDQCPLCQGLLTPLGYTTHSIGEALRSVSSLAEIPVLTIDSDTTTTFKKLSKQISSLSKKNIIITTPAFIPYLPEPDLFIIVSFDGILGGHAYDQDSYVYRLLQTLRTVPTVLQLKQENLDTSWTVDTDTYREYENNNASLYHMPPYDTYIILSKKIPLKNLAAEIIFFKDFCTQNTLVHHINTLTSQKNISTVTISHSIRYQTQYHLEFIETILPLLASYSIKKNPRIIS